MGEDLFRKGDDAHDRRDDDVHRVVLDRVRVDASILQLEDSGRDPERRRRLGGTEGLAGDEDEPFLVVVDAVAEYRGACAGLDAVGACLAAARCSVIDENEIGGPTTCGDAIAGRVHSV